MGVGDQAISIVLASVFIYDIGDMRNIYIVLTLLLNSQKKSSHMRKMFLYVSTISQILTGI